jgi:hypothetical protein
VIYRQTCKDTGLVWVDETQQPVTVPVGFGAGLQPGRLAKLDDSIYDQVIPVVVFADKIGKHIVAVCGFQLE